MVSGIVLDVAAECACCRWPSNLVAATSCPTCFDADRLASPHQDDVGFRYAERRGMSPWSVSVPLQATELHPKVVVGVPADNVALRHPTPEAMRAAHASTLTHLVAHTPLSRCRSMVCRRRCAMARPSRAVEENHKDRPRRRLGGVGYRPSDGDGERFLLPSPSFSNGAIC
jgi:hypothetical protein